MVLGIFLLLRWPVQGGVIAPLATLALRRASSAPSTTTSTPGPARGSGPARSSSGRPSWRSSPPARSRPPTTSPRSRSRSSATSRSTRSSTSSFAAFAIVAARNGVNITDGLDGLAGGTLAFAFVSFMIIALLNVPAQPNLALLCALIIGALLGFLWFNVHPAQIFMGDSGSLSLGATLAVIALITGQILVLPLIGLIFVVETVSVIIQIGYFKALRRQARVPDGAAPPPLRAGRLGRGEDHAPLLDRGHPRRPARRDAVPGLRSMRSPDDGRADADRPRRADAGGRPRRRAARPAGHGARPRPERRSPWPASCTTPAPA